MADFCDRTDLEPTACRIYQLNRQIQPKAIGLINALRSVGVPAIIAPLGGKRSQAEQNALYRSARGVTSTQRSRHVLGMAFDLDVQGMNRNDIPTWWWPIIGQYAESVLGLTWGGRWRSPYDPGHFEL